MSGAGKPGKTEFPKSWSDTKIKDAINEIANRPNAPGGIGDYGAPFKTGTIEGIDIRVDFYPPKLPTGAVHPNVGKVSTGCKLP